MLSIDALEARRQRMNQGGPFDRMGNRSRYDQSQQRQDAVMQQANDIGMRERMQGRDLMTQIGMQQNDIASRYGLAAQEAKARERQAAQSFGHTMAQLNAEFGFKSGEANKERSHVKSMADFEAQLKEVASSKDFKRSLERLAVEYGMSKEKATTAFERMLQGKQVDHSNAVDMEGVKSRYDLLGNDQKFGHDQQLNEQQFGFDTRRDAQQFGFDTQKNQQTSDLALRNQDQYWDRYRDENQALNTQKFTQNQQQAQARELQLRDQQLNAALDSSMMLYDNLDRQGKDALDKAQADLASINEDPHLDDNEKMQARQQLVMPQLQKAMNPQRIVNYEKKYGDSMYLHLPGMKQPEKLKDLKPPASIPFEGGTIIQNPDGSIHSVLGRSQYQQQLKPGDDPRMLENKRRDEWIAEQQKIPQSVPGSAGLTRYPTFDEAADMWDRYQQRYNPSTAQPQTAPNRTGVGASTGQEQVIVPRSPQSMMQGPQPMMQRGPQAQPPRPQNTINPDVARFMQAHIQKAQSSGLSPEQYMQTLPPDQQQLFAQALRQGGF